MSFNDAMFSPVTEVEAIGKDLPGTVVSTQTLSISLYIPQHESVDFGQSMTIVIITYYGFPSLFI
jgi:hypothetical protein